jgi:hypothetical protein
MVKWNGEGDEAVDEENVIKLLVAGFIGDAY